MAYEHVLHLLLLEELVVDVEDRAARIPEDVLYAFFLEAADDDFGTRELHGHGPVRVGDPPPASATRGAFPCCPARKRDGRAHQRLDRVESRVWSARPRPEGVSGDARDIAGGGAIGRCCTTTSTAVGRP